MRSPLIDAIVRTRAKVRNFVALRGISLHNEGGFHLQVKRRIALLTLCYAILQRKLDRFPKG